MFMDALSYLGDALNKPGRAVRGALAGRADELAAIVPFSDSLGITDEGRAVSGRDLLDMYGGSTGNSLGDAVLGFGIDVATDPLTFAGAGLGRSLGRAFGRGLEAAAAARGPGYATTADDLVRMASVGDDAARFGVDQILSSPAASRILGEIPPNSQLLGSGAEAVAFQTPAGDVLRLGREAAGRAGRPVDEAVLGATRAIDFPAATPGQVVRAERLPFARDTWKGSQWYAEPAGLPPPRIDRLAGDLEARGIDFFDRHAGNVGTLGGRDVVIDPGAIDTLPGFAGGFQGVATAANPPWLTRAMLDMMGGQGATRAAIEAGLSGPQYADRFTRLGGLGGAGLGAF